MIRYIGHDFNAIKRLAVAPILMTAGFFSWDKILSYHPFLISIFLTSIAFFLQPNQYYYHQQVSKEGDSFPVDIEVARMSELVKGMLEDESGDDEDTTEIPLPNVKAAVLKKVIEFCSHHKSEPMTEIEKPLKSAVMAEVVQKWYADFVNVEQVLLFELILAANYMDIKPLLDLTCATVASMIKGKTPEEIRKTFNIANDFSPEEEAQVREENKWCEEP